MSATGARKQLKDGIIKILSERLSLEYYGEYEEAAADIMALVPKPEKCVIYKKCTDILHIPYYQCSKCSGTAMEAPQRYCTWCGRRIIAMEDKTIWQ